MSDCQVCETRLATRWPTIGAYGLGRWVGRLVGLSIGYGRIFTIGTLMSLVTLPISLTVYAWQLCPWVCRRYRLTDRRVIVQKGYSACEERAIELDAFDTVSVEVLPGQAWLRTGDLVFFKDDREVFRLAGVPSAESFCRTCQQAKVAVDAFRKAG